jgi:hypothetical protein
MSCGLRKFIVDDYFKDHPDHKRIALNGLETSLGQLEKDPIGPYNTLKRRFIEIDKIISTSEGLTEEVASRFVALLTTSGIYDKELNTLIDELNNNKKGVFTRVLQWWGGTTIKVKTTRSTTVPLTMNDINFWESVCEKEANSPSFEDAIKRIKSLVVNLISAQIRVRSQKALKSIQDTLSRLHEKQLKRALDDQKKLDDAAAWKFLRDSISGVLGKQFDKTK